MKQLKEMEKENRHSANAEQDTETRRRDPWIQRMLHGRILSIDYITSRYECQTKMERIRALETELEVARTERVRAKSAYMSRIRESEMQEMIDSLRLGLTVQEQPPYMLSREQ